MRFGGIPAEAWSHRGENNAHLMPFAGVVSHIRSNLGGGNGNVHWRYCSNSSRIQLFLCIVLDLIIASPFLVTFSLTSNSSDAIISFYDRYKIMAQAMLLLLVVPVQTPTNSLQSSDAVLETRQLITGIVDLQQASTFAEF